MKTADTISAVRLAVLIAAGIAVAYAARSALAGKGVAAAAADAAAVIPSVAANAAAGVVVGIGDVIGVPRTSEDECSRLIAARQLWAASFKCPAGRWISEGVFGGDAHPGAEVNGLADAKPVQPAVYIDPSANQFAVLQW